LRARADSLIRARLAEGGRIPESPHANVMRSDDLGFNLAVARLHSENIAKAYADSGVSFPISSKRRKGAKTITVGYMSSDFRSHPTAHLIYRLFGFHSRPDFDIRAYSTGRDDGSELRRQIAEGCDAFVDVNSLSPLDTAKRIHEDGVDILVELNGHTEGQRLTVCALRPAPINVTYLGFPGTTGAPFIDYILTDRIVSPLEHAAFYSERFAYLPHCYQVNSDDQRISEKGLTRADVGLPEDAFVFASFNQPVKIDPAMYELWMRLLGAEPKSVLWLWRDNNLAVQNLHKEAEARGIAPDRIVFGDKLPREEHLERLRLADLMLDTRICNGHTTTSDALWAGVPVITLEGKHFASRVSASLLTAVGLPELITHSLEEYESLALRLANSPSELDAIKSRLKTNRETAPLFDTKRFARDLEDLYRQMFEIFKRGEELRHLGI
jgi:predicted O-linked N-acetylglucosamine transferase (SPINDLY family)